MANDKYPPARLIPQLLTDCWFNQVMLCEEIKRIKSPTFHLKMSKFKGVKKKKIKQVNYYYLSPEVKVDLLQALEDKKPRLRRENNRKLPKQIITPYTLTLADKLLNKFLNA